MPRSSNFQIGLILVTLLITITVIGNFWLAQASPEAPEAPEGTTIVVNTFVEPTAADGLCSLREAVQAANLDLAVDGCPAGSGEDVIVLSTGVYTLTIPGTYEDAALTGDLDITANLDIQGDGEDQTIISGGNIDRVFHIDPAEAGVSVTMSGLSVQHGAAPDDDDAGGGGILTNGFLVLENVSLKFNNASRGGGLRVDFSGNLSVTDSLFDGNHADDEGGGLYGDGPIKLRRVLIENNESRRGGGVFCDQPCEFMDVSIRKNQATTYGGGLYNQDASELVNVTLSENTVTQLNGGGIYNGDSITLKNVTISANSASLGSGFYSNNEATFMNVTIFLNDSPINGASLYNHSEGILSLTNTIVSTQNSQPDCYGEFESLGNNISGDATCDFSEDNDLISTNPMLDPLLDNGGFTKTHALQANSPAIDAGNNKKCQLSDQRYLSRPVDGNLDDVSVCDIGAYEIAPGGILQFDPLEITVDEAVGNAQLKVERMGGNKGSVSVTFTTWAWFTSGWASSNADFTYTSGILTWLDGDSSPRYIDIPIVDDLGRELDEYFLVYLFNPNGSAGMLMSARSAQVIVQDNEPDSADPATPMPDPNLMFLPNIEKD